MPSKTIQRRSRFSEAERAEYRDAKRSEQRQQVERAVRELLTSEGWQRWAQTRATFHDYSMGNCMLIAAQCPTATDVAGFKAWRELGRQVRKGERAIRIMAPMSVKRENVETGEVERVPFFRAVPVFDVSQTDGDALPVRPCEPLTGDSHERLIPMLEGFARSMGLTVTYADTGNAGGYYSEKQRVIVVDQDACPNAKVRTLVHELAHAHGVTYRDYSRGEAEVIVETAGTIVCGSLGLDTSGESIPYIAGWGESGDLDAIRKHAETVDRIARSIETACGLGRKGVTA